MSDRQRITIEDLITASGTGPRTTRRLVREGKLPGFMEGNRYVCPPGEFQDWLEGIWQYRGVPSTQARKRAPRHARPELLRRVKPEAA